MEIPGCQLRSVQLALKDLADSQKLVGTIKLRGQLDHELAEALKVTKVEDVDAVADFTIDRPEETVEMIFLSENGKKPLGRIKAAVIHQWKIKRKGKDLTVNVQARVDQNGHDAALAFLREWKGWAGAIQLTPSQTELGV